MEYSSSQHASLLQELTCNMGSHSVTCHPADVTFPPVLWTCCGSLVVVIVTCVPMCVIATPVTPVCVWLLHLSPACLWLLRMSHLSVCDCYTCHTCLCMIATLVTPVCVWSLHLSHLPVCDCYTCHTCQAVNSSSSISSQLPPFITFSLFHSWLKTQSTFSHNFFHLSLCSSLGTDATDSWLQCCLSIPVFVWSLMCDTLQVLTLSVSVSLAQLL